jgi:hypothetical protein
MKLSLYQPTHTGKLLQGFGSNPQYYARFLDTNGVPEKGHMGLDYEAAHGTPLYSVCDGMASYRSDSHGGDGICIQPTGTYDYEGGQAYFEVINWHLCSKDDPQYKPLIPTDGGSYPVKAGQLIGYTDNTGAPFESNGNHLHFGLLPVGVDGKPLHPANGFGGCIDPTPYLTPIWAGAIPAIDASIEASETIVKQITQAPISNADKSSLLDQIKKVVEKILFFLQK